MQLIISKLTGATIESNINELDLYMEETKKRYENWVVIETEVKNAKEERAILNKLEKELADTRKKVQKEGLSSIDNFLDKLKESEKEIKILSENINNQIKAFEEQEIETKLSEVSEIKNRIFESNKRLEGFFTPNKKWENKTFKIKDVEIEIQEMFNALNKKYDFILAQLNAWFSINQNHQESVSCKICFIYISMFSINQNHQESVSRGIYDKDI